MKDNDLKRLSRLTAILTQLQAKRISRAEDLATVFSVSKRTIYRDMRALEQAGVPIVAEEGKGYALAEFYRLAPVMFTEEEANALITAEQLIARNKDASLVKEYSGAILKIRSVLTHSTKEKAELLSGRVVFRQNVEQDRSSDYLMRLQKVLTNHELVQIRYYSPETKQRSTRSIEAFALYSTQENWLLIAWCRLRKEFRTFRLDRIEAMEELSERFKPHALSLPEYFEICLKNSLKNG